MCQCYPLNPLWGTLPAYILLGSLHLPLKLSMMNFIYYETCCQHSSFLPLQHDLGLGFFSVLAYVQSMYVTCTLFSGISYAMPLSFSMPCAKSVFTSGVMLIYYF